MNSKSTTSQSFIENFQILSRVSKSKYEVYKAIKKSTKQTVALKIYPYSKENNISRSYACESQAIKLNHPNLIKINNCMDHIRILHPDKSHFDASVIEMEYAPSGDLFEFTKNCIAKQGCDDEKLIRTLFHQMIEGMQHMHQNNFVHLDLKPENLVFGDDFQLQIIDFDQILQTDIEQQVHRKGTMHYRAPELISGKVHDYKLADVFSAGVILFILMTGQMPFMENLKGEKYDLQELLQQDHERFWSLQSKFQNGKELPDSFKTLFESMVCSDPVCRANIEEVIASEWYNEGVYSKREYICVMNKKVNQ